MKNPRRVEIHSHQYYVRGWFYGFSKKDMLAIVESEGGDVTLYDLESVYSMKFTDARDWNE